MNNITTKFQAWWPTSLSIARALSRNFCFGRSYRAGIKLDVNFKGESGGPPWDFKQNEGFFYSTQSNNVPVVPRKYQGEELPPLSPLDRTLMALAQWQNSTCEGQCKNMATCRDKYDD